MGDILNDLLPVDDLIVFGAIREEEEQVVPPQDGRLRFLWRLDLLTEPVFQPVLQNPDAYLMQRYVPVEEVPMHWEEYSGDNYLGVQQHRQEEFDAPEQVEDMDNEEEEKETMDCTKASSQYAEAMAFASPHVSKRDNSITDDGRLLKDIASSSSFSVATIGPQDSPMPDASPATFGPTLEPVPSNPHQ